MPPHNGVLHQTNMFGIDLLVKLDPNDHLLAPAAIIPWQEFEESFCIHDAKGKGAPSKPIRLMVGLLLLKQLENLSDEKVVLREIGEIGVNHILLYINLLQEP